MCIRNGLPIVALHPMKIDRDGPVPEEPRLTCAGSVAAQQHEQHCGDLWPSSRCCWQNNLHFFLALCRSLSTKITEREMTKLQASISTINGSFR